MPRRRVKTASRGHSKDANAPLPDAAQPLTWPYCRTAKRTAPTAKARCKDCESALPDRTRCTRHCMDGRYDAKHLHISWPVYCPALCRSSLITRKGERNSPMYNWRTVAALASVILARTPGSLSASGETGGGSWPARRCGDQHHPNASGCRTGGVPRRTRPVIPHHARGMTPTDVYGAEDVVPFIICGRVRSWDHLSRELWIDRTPVFVVPDVTVPRLAPAQRIWVRGLWARREMTWIAMEVHVDAVGTAVGSRQD